MLEPLRSERRAHTGYGLEVFDRVWNAIERPTQLTPHGPALGLVGGLTRQLGRHGQKRVEPRVEPVDALQHGLDDFDRGYTSSADPVAQLRGGSEAQFIVFDHINLHV